MSDPRRESRSSPASPPSRGGKANDREPGERPEAERAIDPERAARRRSRVDESTRVPVLTFFCGGVFWLLAGSVLAMLASIKLHTPEFLDGASWLTFGRVRPAHLNAMIYGWASPTGIGVILWLTARLAKAELRFPRLLVAAAAIWNFAVLLGTIGILRGEGTSIEWIEFPPYVPPLLVLAFSIVSLSVATTFHDRGEAHVYVSQWYIFGAIFWFPWLYTVVELLMVYRPMAGSPQASVNWWFAHNVLGLWLTPIGLASIYYLIPKVLGRPVHSYYLSIVGFWSLALFYNWAGAHHLIGGPVPAWLVTVSVVASLMMLIPVGTVAINHHFTMAGRFAILKYSPTLRFIVFGAMSYTAVSLQGSFQSLRDWNEVTHFTHYTIAHAHLGVYSFFTMTMFGALYYIMPRLTRWEWASARLIRVHFWGTAGGMAIYWIGLTWGGVLQGMAMNDPQTPFLDIVKMMIPYLWSRSLAGVLMTTGHAAFAALFTMNMLHLGKRRYEPTLLDDPREYARLLASPPAWEEVPAS